MVAGVEARAQAHRELLKQALAAEGLQAIRSHLNKDRAFGSLIFQSEVEAMALRRARIRSQGRSQNPKEDGGR
jgi:hypothetical protein